MTSPKFTCPRCGLSSYNQNDIDNLFCGSCHVFWEPKELRQAEEVSRWIARALRYDKEKGN